MSDMRIKTRQVIAQQLAIKWPDAPNIGVYEAGYHVLHPFGRVSIEACLNFNSPDLWDKYLPGCEYETVDSMRWAFSKAHWMALIYAKRVSWREVGEAVGISSIRDLCACVYPMVGLDPISKNHDAFYAAFSKLLSYAPPADNYISPLLLPDLEWIARETGNDGLWFIGWGEPTYVPLRKLNQWWSCIEGPRADHEGPRAPADYVIAPDDRSWVAFTEWEAIETEFYGPEKLLRRFVTERRLEGFWSVPPAGVSPTWFRDGDYPQDNDFQLWNAAGGD